MRRFLMPREHGTYAQLSFPLLSGLLLGRPAVPAFALALATVCVFLAYEPFAVLLGVRGARLQSEESTIAKRQLAGLAPIAVLLGIAGLVTAPYHAQMLVLIPAGLCALLVPLVPARRVKSLAGETIVAAALATMHLPIAAASGVTGLRLWGPAVVWFAGFFLATLAVHAIKARHKQRDGRIRIVAQLSALASLLVAIAMILWLPPLRMFGIVLGLPLAAVIAVNAARIHPRELRRVGWTLVTADLATLALFMLL